MKPTTGWYNGNDADWDGMGDPEYPNYGRYCSECGNELHKLFQGKCTSCRCEIDWEDEEIAPDEKQYYGSWKRKGRFWSPDRSGDFAAIFDSNDNGIAVVWSKFVRYGHQGSPCIPGQVHAEPDDPSESPSGVAIMEMTPGEVAPYGRPFVSPYYALPDYCLGEKNEQTSR